MATRSPKPNGELFRTLRLKKGLTREKLAQLADCSARKIEDIENGRPTSISILAQCAPHLCVEDPQVLLVDKSKAKRDTVIVLVIRSDKYATLEEAYAAVKPILDDLSKDYERICVEYGSILVTLAVNRSFVGRIQYLTWRRRLSDVGVMLIDILRRRRSKTVNVGFPKGSKPTRSRYSSGREKKEITKSQAKDFKRRREGDYNPRSDRIDQEEMISFREALKQMRRSDRRLLEARYIAGYTIGGLAKKMKTTVIKVEKKLRAAESRFSKILRELQSNK